MAINAGTRFDRYEIIAPLGRGGMGEVYVARDTQLGRKVALKFLPELFTADRARLARFAQEARAASALNHPNIITIHEIGQADATHYIATEFIEGETLRQRLVRAPLTIEEAVEIAAQTCAALAAAHEAGIVHRDIKPENVMLRRDGYVKVLDFGLAKLTDTDYDDADTEAQTRQLIYTAPGTVVGTVDYMSPEQARGLEVDARTDIWALGVVLYEMVAGRRPFTGETKPDVLAAILKTEPEPLASPHEPLPDELRRIVHKTLRVRREERYQTIRDLLVDLKSLKRELEFSAHSLRVTAPAMQPAQASPTAQIPAASTAASSILAAPRFSLRHALLLVPLAALVVGATWWFVARRNGQINASALKTMEVVSWRSTPGEVYSAGTFSPDARIIAFASTKSGTKNIWVKQTTTGEPVQVTNDEFKNDGPVWSPTGEEIAFFSQRGEQYGIWRIPALGGTPTLVKTFAAGEGDVRPKRWAKNGLIYYELRQNLFALDGNTGSATQVTDLAPNRAAANSFSISPDGERIAYISLDEHGGNNVCYVPARGGGQPVQLTKDNYEHRNTIWASDSQRVLYSAKVDGTFQIFAVALDGQPPLQLTTGERDSFVLDVSADGTRVLYGATQEESDVWSVRVAGGAEFAVATDITAELWPAAAPDGQTVVYQAIKNLSQGDKLFNGALVAKRADADAPPLQLAAEGFLPQWSPDGKQVAFMRLTGDSYSLWTVPATGGGARQLVASGLPSPEYSLLPYNRYQVNSFSWSPDGSKIAYCSRAGGARNLRVAAADGTGDTQITNNDDVNLWPAGPIWSPDGKRIAYAARRLNKSASDARLTYGVWLVAPETKETRAVYQSDSLLRLLGWSQTEKELLIATLKSKTSIGTPTDVGLLQVAIETGAPRPIAELSAIYFHNIHLSPDRRSIAFAAHRDGKDNVWLLPVAGGEARRLTANNDPRLYFSSFSWSPDGRTLYFGKQSRHSLLSMITNFQ
ncbi:MAG: protein kinase domain-containing protein [Pyrinomonadaceae bacterium]